jgi:hypothetical protein
MSEGNQLSGFHSGFHNHHCKVRGRKSLVQHGADRLNRLLVAATFMDALSVVDPGCPWGPPAVGLLLPELQEGKCEG